MASENGGEPKATLEVNIGKEIDAALGDVVRGLLKRPSEVIGDLLADGIGILGDRVRAKFGSKSVFDRLQVTGRCLAADWQLGTGQKDPITPAIPNSHSLLSFHNADDE